MQSPRSVIAAVTLLLGSVSVAAAIFLIEELDTPPHPQRNEIDLLNG